MSFTSPPPSPPATTGPWALSRLPGHLAGQQRGQHLCRHQGLWFPDLHVPLHQLLGSLGSRGLVAGMVGVLARMGGIQNEKETMQSLNNHLTSYLDRVRSLETEKWKLESKIREHLEKKRPQIDNACLTADFKVKYETELAMCQSVESDIHGLRKLQLDTEIKALKEELLFMKKKHEEEVKGLQAQIASSGLTVEVNAPHLRTSPISWQTSGPQYDEQAPKNREELDKHWSQQIKESTTVVTTQSSKIGAAEIMIMEQRCTVQSLEIDLDSDEKPEDQLGEQPEGGGGQLCPADGAAQGDPATPGVGAHTDLGRGTAPGPGVPGPAKHQDGEDFNLGDALNSSNSHATIQKITTYGIVDGNVVSETNDNQVLRH
ncbi:Keratin, type I cytoskeletal 18 [Plecturocebus cupreus]